MIESVVKPLVSPLAVPLVLLPQGQAAEQVVLYWRDENGLVYRDENGLPVAGN